MAWSRSDIEVEVVVLLLALTTERLPCVIDTRRRRFPATGHRAWGTRTGPSKYGCYGPTARGCGTGYVAAVVVARDDRRRCCLRRVYDHACCPDGVSESSSEDTGRAILETEAGEARRIWSARAAMTSKAGRLDTMLRQVSGNRLSHTCLKRMPS